MSNQVADTEGDEQNDNGSERTAVQRLLRLAEGVRLFRADDGRLFARVPVGHRVEVHGLRSGAFRDWLIGEHFQEFGVLPPDGAIRRVIGALEAFARFGSGAPQVFIRVGGNSEMQEAGYYIDLGDVTGHAIHITAEGWSVCERPEVEFRRPDGLLPMPRPVREGSIELLRPYVNLSPSDFRLLVAWMAAALRRDGPYPILALYGEQGSAKSTLARIIRSLIDPQDSPLLSEPGSTRDLMVTATNGWLLAYDNISVIRPWLSDGLCRLATGGGFAARSLFSNDERTVLHAQRPVILNGIEEFVQRGDLSDRTVFLNLAPIPPGQRRREDELWAAFYRERPLILGSLLDAVAGGMRELPAVKLAELPRMADFAAFAEAVGRALGWNADTVIADYNNNRKDATAAQIEDSMIASAMLERTPETVNWWGTPTELLKELGDQVGQKVASSARWPKSPSVMTNELRRIAPQLRSNGVSVTFERTAGKRIVCVRTTHTQEPARHPQVDL